MHSEVRIEVVDHEHVYYYTICHGFTSVMPLLYAMIGATEVIVGWLGG